METTERSVLLARHRRERDGRVRDRMKAVLLRDDGWSFERIAEALFLTDEGVRQHVEDYLKENGNLSPAEYTRQQAAFMNTPSSQPPENSTSDRRHKRGRSI